MPICFTYCSATELFDNSMLYTANSTVNNSCQVDVLQIVAYAPIFLLGLIINATALCAFFTKRGSWSDTHIYMLNLCLADFALISFLPFRIYDAFFCLNLTTFCTFLMSTHYINMYASMFTTTAISIHRFLVVKFPIQANAWRRKKETAFAVCLTMWVAVVSVCAGYYKVNLPENLWTCYERLKDRPLPLHFVLLLAGVAFLFPLLIIAVCSTQTVCTLLKDAEDSVEKKGVIAIVTANMIIFIFCYTPFHVGCLVNYFDNPPADWQQNSTYAHKYLLVSEWIATTNCCLDAIGYYFLFRSFIHKTTGKGASEVRHKMMPYTNNTDFATKN